MIGSLAAVELPADLPPAPADPAPDADPNATYPLDPLHAALLNDHMIEVPVYPWPHTPADGGPLRRVLRVSAQLHNSPEDYDRLAMALANRRSIEPNLLAHEQPRLVVPRDEGQDPQVCPADRRSMARFLTIVQPVNTTPIPSCGSTRRRRRATLASCAHPAQIAPREVDGSA